MKNRKGMTLIEVVVAMAIFGIIMVTLFPAFLITNLMNNISKEFTDANYMAQMEMENLYNYSLDNTFGDTLLFLSGTQGYTCTAVDANTGSCTKDVDNFRYLIHYIDKQPHTSLTTIKVDVSVLTGEHAGKRGQLESFIMFESESGG